MRSDVLVYTSAPLQRDLTVIGPVRVVLWAATDGPDTDWTAKLVDVWPSGRAENLTDGILRARYRVSLSEPTPLVPGKTTEFRIAVGPTANVFLPGHRVRLEVSSSNFPRFDPNTNTGGDVAIEGREALRSATNIVYHERSWPSHLLLPVVSR
jgi:putative CocE/NonD family hydrolase